MKTRKKQPHSLLPTPYSLFILLFLFSLHFSFALDFSVRPGGFVYVPGKITTAEGNALYTTGGGGSLGFEVDFSSLWPNPLGIGYTLGVEGSMVFNGIRGDVQKNLSIYSFGGCLGLYYFPLSRLFTRIDTAIGAYTPAIDGNAGFSNFYWRGGGEAGFRFTPGFTLAANFGYRHFHGKKQEGNGLFSNGFYAGLTAQLTFQTGKNSNRESIGITLDQGGPVYPVFMQLYQKTAIGALVIRNNENAEIRDVRVSFRAPPYTSSEYPCGTVSFLARGRSAQLSLLAIFSPEILRFTDKGRILGEVVIRYRFLGQEREAVRACLLAAHNRNTVAEGDPAALAAFISPTSPETVDYAKYIAGLARNDRRTGHNQNFQYAVWLLEGLRASGIKLDNTFTNAGEAQFPAETLSFRSGSARDLAILFAAGLESVGIQAAFVQTEDDFLAAVSLNINQSAAETLFNGTNKILLINNQVWLPLSMAAFNEGFTAAWAKGAAVLGETFREGKTADFVLVEEAWADYPPAPLPEQGGRAVRTDSAAAAREVNRAMQQYIETEIQPVVRQVQAQAYSTPTAAMYNRLGIVLVRAGRTAEGKANYERAANMGSVPAMTNRGNLALIEKDYAAAERWFRQALAIESKNAAALRGLEQIQENK